MLHRATLSQQTTTERSTDGGTHVLRKWMDGIPAAAKSKLEWSAGGKKIGDKWRVNQNYEYVKKSKGKLLYCDITLKT